MGIMNIVWPVTALYSGPLGVWAYFKIGREVTTDHASGSPTNEGSQSSHNNPFWTSVLKGALHCGSGCTIGDLLAELFLFFVPISVGGSRLLGSWTVDFVFAFLIGILFQYFAIRPMRKMSKVEALVAALKADTLSLLFWQVGMYGWMAVCIFVFYHRVLTATEPLFWCMMQAAMLIGLVTAFPVNWWLLKKGIKEAM